ncbi:MAG: CRTAC1 family protein, partial [Planctomycetaceae bacterium]
NFESHLPALYRNVGGGGLAWAYQSAGVGRLGGRNVGFGTSFLDYDNDGWEDLVFVNGHVVRHPVGAEVRQSPVLLRNIDRHGRRMFADETQRGGAWFQKTALGRGLATGDLDND